jgi:hypothetical protein
VLGSKGGKARPKKMTAKRREKISQSRQDPVVKNHFAAPRGDAFLKQSAMLTGCNNRQARHDRC